MSTKEKKVGRRGRISLSEADKANMQARREASVLEKKQASEVLASNPQFQNPKFWATVDFDTASAVADAIRKGGDKVKQAKIDALKAELAKLEI